MDSDYEVFSILPPYNTINAQVLNGQGDLVTSPNVTVTYKGIADPTGSINLSSTGKADFWDHSLDLFGVTLPPDQGLAGNSMPGLTNTPQAMHFDPATNWFSGEGIPITPTDDAGHSQAYPMMRLEARDAGGVLRATTDIVLPVSSEMDCRACHASGSGPAAKPAAGWISLLDFDRDYRLNILKLHDERQVGNGNYTAALANFGFNSSGLYETVVTDGKSILCSACHASNALPGTGFGAIQPLTQALHSYHADVLDPVSGLSMNASSNRASCYRCHPGSETRCLRGAMGSAVAADGGLSMQCQDCHGNMAEVGDPARIGWLQEPSCQSCHTGDAVINNGQIRYESVFEPSGLERVPVNQLFATNPDTPGAGLNLYRFSSGHGELQCSACHGSTHAVYPSAHSNDNLQSIALQGHVGTITDCTACHAEGPETDSGGPHGMHPVGQPWMDDHKDAAENGKHTNCRACHGTDYRGTELSRAQGPRSLNTKWGPKELWEGYEVGCWSCHQGPLNDNENNNTAPVANPATATVPAGTQVAIPLVSTDANGDLLTLRIVNQPHYGTVALAGTTATYFPYEGYAGADQFQFASSDGDEQSNLAMVRIMVTANWNNFGEGLPGTLGVPALTANAVPSQGSTIGIHIGNSNPAPTLSLVLLGERPFFQPTTWSGVLLVKQPLLINLQLPPGGLNINYPVPVDPALLGHNIIAQVAVVDPGASAGLAFSEGLRLTFGQ